jgi:L-lysine exporter family protein LysE/ArgO
VLTALLVGLVAGLSLIIAIGAQNAFVLRQGMAREHMLPVVLVCLVSDVVLIAAGVAGIGAIVERADWAIDVVRWLGVAFLTTYGVMTLWRARRPSAGLETDGPPKSTSLRTAVLKAAALTWLNPHVYLDTVLLLGSLSANHGDVGRWWFALGACLGSTVWFFGLGYGARLLSPLLKSPRAWQLLDVGVAATMLIVAASLALGD